MRSLSKFLGCSESELSEMLSYDWEKDYVRLINSSEIYLDKYRCFGNYIFCNLSLNVDSYDRPKIHWFHGTRAFDINDFKSRGILPADESFSYIKDKIDNIAIELNLEKTVSNIAEFNKDYIDNRLSSNDCKGPFSVLMFESALYADRFGFRYYINYPEMVEHYIKWKYGNSEQQIFAKFKEYTTPIIIEFIEPNDTKSVIPMSSIVGTILSYLYNKIHSSQDSSWHTTCHSNQGKTIMPKQIVNIYDARKKE